MLICLRDKYFAECILLINFGHESVAFKFFVDSCFDNQFAELCVLVNSKIIDCRATNDKNFINFRVLWQIFQSNIKVVENL